MALSDNSDDLQRLALAACNVVAKTLLVADVAESVLLMARDEASTVAQIQAFLLAARGQVLPRHGGEFVASLGDGLLATFPSPAQAAAAAHELHALTTQMPMRIAIHASTLMQSEDGVYGLGVQLARAMTSLVRPGETLVSETAVDGIVEGIDAAVEDMGERTPTGWPHAVRAWRMTVAQAARPGSNPASMLESANQPEQAKAVTGDLTPVIGVLPFSIVHPSDDPLPLGELLADRVNQRLTRHKDLKVIARLSCSRLKDRQADLAFIGERLGATHLISGEILPRGGDVEVHARLIGVESRETLWQTRLLAPLEDLIDPQSSLAGSLSEQCAKALLDVSAARALVLPLPRLSSNTLLLGAISLMHRSSPTALAQAGTIMDLLLDRHPRHPTAWSWQAKLQIFKGVQDMGNDRTGLFKLALEATERALDSDSTSPIALALRGHTLTHLGRNIADAKVALDHAIALDPNDPMAWLYQCTWTYLWGNKVEALEQSKAALDLSPLDPHRYYFLMQRANALWVNGLPEQTVAAATASLHANGMHIPTYRVLIAALHGLDRLEEARALMHRMRHLDPHMTVNRYLSSGGDSEDRRRIAQAMRACGLPEK